MCSSLIPKLRRLSAQEFIGIFNEFGFEIISQKGSSVKSNIIFCLKLPAEYEFKSFVQLQYYSLLRRLGGEWLRHASYQQVTKITTQNF